MLSGVGLGGLGGLALHAAISLRLFGIPVFHEGYYIVIPEGTFIVAEICALVSPLLRASA